MAVVTIRPDGTTANNMVVVGAATAHTALGDESDSSYIGPAGVADRYAICSLGDIATVPAGAVNKSVRVAIRQASGSPAAAAWAVNIDELAQGAFLPSTSSITVVSTPEFPLPANFDPNGLTVRITATTGDGVVYEAYAYVKYAVQPVVTVTAPTGTVTNTTQPTVAWTATFDPDA